MNEELDYVSSAPDILEPKREVNPADESNLSTLERLVRLLDRQIEAYKTVDNLDLTDTVFSIEQQIAINKEVIVHLMDIRGLVQGTISDIKERYKNG